MKYIEFGTNKKYDIILIGRATIDFNPIDYYKPLGECESFKKYVGGSPANLAVGLSRLGKKCGFIGRISDDQFGDYIENYFKKEGIDTSHMKRCTNGEKLGLTFTEILDEKTSRILMYRNKIADLSTDPCDVDEEYIKSARCILISGTALCQSPSREACLKAVALAKKNDVKIIFDIDYREYIWNSMDEVSLYYSIVAHEADLIMGSREEFDNTEKFLGLDGTDKTSANYWLNKKAKLLVIKHGAKGSTAYLKDGSSYNAKPSPYKMLKGFGGGDGYGSSFISALLDDKDVVYALEHGAASAMILIGSHGCSEFMPKLSDVDNFIAKVKSEHGEIVTKN